MTQVNDVNNVWFKDGLRFECTRCGACCTGSEGFVWVNDAEVAALATRLGITEGEFRKSYTRRAQGKTTLIEREGGDCIFWQKSKGCTVYEDRPRQCRTWPFWNSNIHSESDWEYTTEICPGAGKGQLFTVEEILRQAKVIDI